MKLYTYGIEVAAGEVSPAGATWIGRVDDPIATRPWLTVVDRDGQPLNERLSRIGQGEGPRMVVDYLEETDLLYGSLACEYHLQNLALAYHEVTSLFERMHPQGGAVSGNTVNRSVFFETDAFLVAARRWYELLRRVVWKHYGNPARTRPGNFLGVLNGIQGANPGYIETLKVSWSQHGENLKYLRDCVSHNDPVNDGTVSCHVLPVGGHWELTVRLPKNPKAKSRSGYDLSGGPDALDFCHQTLCHLADLGDATCALPEVRHYLDHAPGFDGRPKTQRRIAWECANGVGSQA